MGADSTSAEETAEAYCRNCGEPVGPDASFCPECGTELTQPSTGAESTVSPKWYYGLVGGIGLIVLAVVIAGAASGNESAETVFGLFFLSGWVLLIVSMYFDTKRIRAVSDWSPNRVLWIAGTVIPYWNFLVVGAYLYRRHNYVTDSSAGATADSAGAQSGDGATPQPETGRETPSDGSRPKQEPKADRDRPEPDTDRDEPDPSRSEGENEPTTARVSPEQIYMEGGTRYVETPVGPDKRLYTDSDGNHYFERGSAMRALYGAIAAAAIAGAVFFVFFFPEAPGGPASPRGGLLFSLVDAVPFGNVIVGLLAVWIAYQLASVAYRGREYVAIEDST